MCLGPALDNITINDLTGTDVKEVAIDLGVGADNRQSTLRPEPT